MLSLAFLASTISAIYNIDRWKFDFGTEAFTIIITCVIITLVINTFAHYYYGRRRPAIYYGKITPISFPMTLLSLTVIGGAFIGLLTSIKRISGGVGTFSLMMQTFRMKNAYSTDLENQLPIWVRQILNLSNSICIIFIFNIIYFWKELKSKQKLENIAVIVSSITASLLTGGRFSAMCTVIAGFVMYYLLRIKQTKKWRVFKIKSILTVLLIVMAVLYGFYAVKELVGRESADTVVEYITHYAGGAIPGLDLYLKSPPAKSSIWGKETFYSLNNNLRKLRLLNVPYYFAHREFRVSNGVSIGNVYTALRDYHYDFGLGGMFALHLVFSMIFSVSYERLKRKLKDKNIIVFSMMYYCVVFYSISNTFFANIISIGFLIRIIMTIALYTLLLEKRPRVRFR